MEEKERTLVDEEGEPRTPSQSTLEEGEDVEKTNKKCCGSNNHVIVKSRHQVECKSPSYALDCMHTSK
jgi:hypothetical protein